MIDPLPAAPQFLKDAVQPIADRLGLQTLPLHLHEILSAFSIYLLLGSYVAPALSTWLLPRTYPRLPPRTSINWNIHVVSLFQSTLICSLALWVILMDKDRELLDSKGRIWGYNGATGMTQALAAGYFAWDVFVSSKYVSILGWGSLAHAASALIIVSLGFVSAIDMICGEPDRNLNADRKQSKCPFANYYGVAFVLYELSTPFLNFHWFLDKCQMTGSRVQLYNGIALVIVFFGCRLLWGVYLSAQIYRDMWDLNRPLDELRSGKMPAEAHKEFYASYLGSTQLYDTSVLSSWLVYVYLGSNTVLTALNFYWFSQMLLAIGKRFPAIAHSKPKDRAKKHSS